MLSMSNLFPNVSLLLLMMMMWVESLSCDLRRLCRLFLFFLVLSFPVSWNVNLSAYVLIQTGEPCGIPKISV